MGKLDQLFSTSAHDLVGIQSRIEEVERLLDIDSDDVVRVVGIWGMGGIGKTTLAAAVYDTISHKFDASCFLADVREVSGVSGLVTLQEQLLRETLDQKNLKIRDIHEGAFLIRTRLSRLRTLIVLDDVSSFESLEALAKKDWFGEGTRVIITTRDMHLLRMYGVDEVCGVEILNDDDSLKLFCRNAFKCDYFKKDYEHLIDRTLQCVRGHPLAIKLWGSHLLYQNVSQWESALDRMKRVPNGNILEYIKAGYDALEDSEKETFLDVACFFIGEKINYVEEILRYREFYSETAIRTLIDRSLIYFSDQRIQMHDLVRELGLNIIRRESIRDPGKRSRLCSHQDVHYVMKKNARTDGVEAIVLYPESLQRGLCWAEALSNMRRLGLLIFRRYPLTCLPSNFEPRSLVQLIMPNSSVRLLWEGIKIFPNLRNMDLRDSKDLIKTPDFRGVPNVERLNLEGCTELLRLDSSIGILSKLKFLNLRNCTSLVSVPNSLFDLKSLENLNLAGCSKLAECLDFDDWRSSIEVKVLNNQDAPFLKKCPEAHQFWKKGCEHYKPMGIVFNRSTVTGVLHHNSTMDPLNLYEEGQLDDQYSNDEVHINVDENFEEDYVAESTECSTHKRKRTISMPKHKLKKHHTSNEMSEALQVWTISSKEMMEESLARTERYRSKSVEITSLMTKENDYSHVKCVKMLSSFEDISDDVYVAAIDKFNDEGWRQMFLTMPIERKKAWLTRLI